MPLFADKGMLSGNKVRFSLKGQMFFVHFRLCSVVFLLECVEKESSLARNSLMTDSGLSATNWKTNEVCELLMVGSKN